MGEGAGEGGERGGRGGTSAVKVRTARYLAEETVHLAEETVLEARHEEAATRDLGAGRTREGRGEKTLKSAAGPAESSGPASVGAGAGVSGLDLKAAALPALALLGLKWKEEAGDGDVRREDSILSTGTNTEGSSFELMV